MDDEADDSGEWQMEDELRGLRDENGRLRKLVINVVGGNLDVLIAGEMRWVDPRGEHHHIHVSTRLGETLWRVDDGEWKDAPPDFEPGCRIVSVTSAK